MNYRMVENDQKGAYQRNKLKHSKLLIKLMSWQAHNISHPKLSIYVMVFASEIQNLLEESRHVF